jgi:hypothetical protein
MKKNSIVILSLMAFLMAASLKSEAQILIVDDQEFLNSNRNGTSAENLPIIPQLGLTTDQYAPLGGGWIVLGCLGGAYLLGKRKRKDCSE